ncbi:MAG: flavin reductase family protein [Defluviitaleaceae bacterium]|nr:flavin reductase family protein [Defluviitaleaceae bacterium]
MKKSVQISNKFCPQTLFLYGTYKEDGSPNFGLFCWFSYYWDGEKCVMACIGENKLTKDRIHANKVFSANLVTEELLPLADYWGNKAGNKENKMQVPAEIEKGSVLNVPILTKSPWIYELEVAKTIPLKENSEIFLCKIKNVLADESLCTEGLTIEQGIKMIKPALTVGATYFGWDGNAIGSWGDPMKGLPENILQV